MERILEHFLGFLSLERGLARNSTEAYRSDLLDFIEVLHSAWVPDFPAVTRDLALVVDQQVASGVLLAGLQQVAPAIVQRIELFDQYQGKGVEPNRKSLAFRVVMQETQRTLEDAEVDAAMNALTRHAEEALGAKLRG